MKKTLKKVLRIVGKLTLVLALLTAIMAGATMAKGVVEQKEVKAWGPEEVALTVAVAPMMPYQETYASPDAPQAENLAYVEADIAWDDAGNRVCTAARGKMLSLAEDWRVQEGSLIVREGLWGEVLIRYSCTLVNDNNVTMVRTADVSLNRDGTISTFAGY